MPSALDEFAERLSQSLEAGGFAGLVLSKPVAADAPRNVHVRAIELQGETRYQWTESRDRKETHENLTAADTLARARSLIGATYRNAHLFTADADYALRINRKGETSLQKSRPTQKPAVAAHDRSKEHLIADGRPCAFLEAIGVMTADGRVRAKSQHKFRQINRYLEFVEDIYRDLPSTGTLHVVDFGCGKSYLTFALHHLLTRIHGRSVRIVGLDRQPSIIETCRDIAARLQLEGIEFRVGDIVSHSADDKVHLAVSLHACDTATDAALAKAVAWQADVIMSVPCCQHELARVMQGPPLIAQYGLFQERFAAMATDALRAAALDAAGYRTQVIEFIETEHTPKNVLLRGVRRPPGEPPSHRIQREASALRQLLGIDSFTLDRLIPRAADVSLPSGR